VILAFSLSMLFLFDIDFKSSTWLLEGISLGVRTISGPAILHSGGSGGADLAVEAIFSSLRRRPSSPPDCYVTLFHLQGQESHIMRCKFKL